MTKDTLNSIEDISASERASDIVAKPPVSLLQELFQKQGLTPQYDLVQVEGAMHEAVYKYRVTVGGFTGGGSGKNKKVAKHSAAKALLETLVEAQGSAYAAGVGQVPLSDVPLSTLSSLVSAATSSCCDDGISGNPVVSLVQMCRELRCSPPSYQDREEEGIPNNRIFTIQCIMVDPLYTCSVTTTGTGRSKKLAKRKAANEMIKKLSELLVEKNYKVDDGDKIAEGLSRRRFQDSDVKKGWTKVPTHVSLYHQDLKLYQGGNLAKLHGASMAELGDMDCVEVLEQIGKEQNFAVTFVGVENISKRGKYQCMVQICTDPIAVCFGEGGDAALAKEAAARDALDYLKLMTRL